MNSTMVFFYFVLPLLVAGLGWVAVLANDWNEKRRERLLPPGE